MRIFPKSYKAQLILGTWWIAEAFIEINIAAIILTPAEWEIVGSVGSLMFISSLFAALYGVLCFGKGWIGYNYARRAKKAL